MADIATVFSWAPSVYHDMELAELMEWHKRAVARYEAQHHERP
ncbi:TPA: GpE family phage tail protein [Escherichia coli]|nr:GpE family phage tail protein [Escherichia coli]